MPVYKWVAENQKGKTIKGELDAPNEKVVTLQLKRRNLIPKKIKEKPKDIFANISFMKPPVKPRDIVIFTRQFSTIIDAGLPLVQGLSIIAEQVENKTLQEVLQRILQDVQGGSDLAGALSKHPKHFDDLYVNLVSAGEIGGILDTILQRLATYIENAQKLKAKVKGALVYPIVIIAIAIIVVAVIMIFVIPVFQDLFEGFGSALPGPTQLVVNMSNFTKSNWYWILLGLMAVSFAFKKFRQTAYGRKITDSLSLKLPVFGDLLKKVAVARFTRTLGTMLGSGVSIVNSLEIVAKTSGNVILEEIIYDIRSAVMEGQTITEPLSQTDIFPGMVVQMISAGEVAGALDAMLEKIAVFYDDEVNTAVDALTSLLEPIMMVVLGGIIGGLVVAMYLPIFTMASAVGG